MLRRIDKRGDAPDLIVLATMTILIVAILVMFAVVSAIVKEVAGDRSGEKIYKDGEVGVGDIKEYMSSYNDFVMMNALRENSSISELLGFSEGKIEREFYVTLVWDGGRGCYNPEVSELKTGDTGELVGGIQEGDLVVFGYGQKYMNPYEFSLRAIEKMDEGVYNLECIKEFLEKNKDVDYSQLEEGSDYSQLVFYEDEKAERQKFYVRMNWVEDNRCYEVSVGMVKDEYSGDFYKGALSGDGPIFFAYDEGSYLGVYPVVRKAIYELKKNRMSIDCIPKFYLTEEDGDYER
jgi:hypothetical protein